MVFWQLTIDANDPARLARFWAQALGYQPAPPTEPKTAWWTHYRSRLGAQAAFHDRLFDPHGLRPPIWFQRVPETKAGKNRLHLDLPAARAACHSARTTSAGPARRTRRRNAAQITRSRTMRRQAGGTVRGHRRTGRWAYASEQPS